MLQLSEVHVDTLTRRVEQDTGVEAALVKAIAWQESRWDADAPDGAAGEVGIAQVKPGTARLVGFRGSDAALRDPLINLTVAGLYLGQQLARYGGDVASAVSAYNAGTATPANYGRYTAPVLEALTEFRRRAGRRGAAVALLAVGALLVWAMS